MIENDEFHLFHPLTCSENVISLPETMSGYSTPLSASRTLSSPPSPKLKAENGADSVFFNPRIQPSQIVEYLVSRPKTSSTIFVYDLAEQAGFGTLTKAWSKSGRDSAQVVDLQTRAGAGLTLVGRLSEGTSQDAVITAFTSAKGLSMMAPSLSYLPPAKPTSKLVLQVPNLLFTESIISASLYPVANALPILPKDIVVLLSATPQEVVDFAQIAYRLPNHHVVHVFDHYSAARETGHSITPLPLFDVKSDAPADVLKAAGYSFFTYTGAADASTIVVVPNGPLALAAKAFANKASGLGVVVANVLRPWDDEALLATIPTTAKTVHVLDDVANVSSQGVLYAEVFSSFFSNASPPIIHGHGLTPEKSQHFLSQQDAFVQFLSSLSPTEVSPSLLAPSAKRLILFSTPKTSLTSLPHVLEEMFISNQGLSARLLTDHDAFSTSRGVTANRLLLALKKEVSDAVPLPIAIPYNVTSGSVDFVGVLDQNLLKSHTVLQYAKQNAVVLVATSWTSAELIANLPNQTKEIIQQKGLTVFTINASTIASTLR